VQLRRESKAICVKAHKKGKVTRKDLNEQPTRQGFQEFKKGIEEMSLREEEELYGRHRGGTQKALGCREIYTRVLSSLSQTTQGREEKVALETDGKRREGRRVSVLKAPRQRANFINHH